jgi:signal transduction histidine kinase
VAVSVRDSMAAYAQSIGVTLNCECESVNGSAGFDVIGSAAALRRALTALVDNALGHGHDGGTVELRVGRTGAKVMVAVADDGVGIDPEAVATLFTRFSHGAEHTSREGREPYGIGLALVREIADAHGGDVAVASTPGAGATFTLTLPAARQG